MHIPDGYLSPQTCATLGGAMVPLWYTAARKVERKLPSSYIPLLAMTAAFSFVIQMFNVPIPNGTTAHVVGATLIAVLLGPWAAVIAMTITLVIQALFFGDGGLTAIGANVFNMGVVAPFVGWGVYRLMAGPGASASRQRLAAGIGAFFGANAAGLATGIELGVQPLLFKTAEGAPLYSPYGLEQAVPAMLGAHLLVVGPLEGIVTALAVAYLQNINPALLAPAARATTPAAAHASGRWLRAGVAVLLLLAVASPVGTLAAGSAWGEWGPEELQAMLGFVPAGMETLSGVWAGLLPGYNLPGWDNEWLGRLGYLVSALLGIGVVGGVAMALGRVLSMREKRHGNS